MLLTNEESLTNTGENDMQTIEFKSTKGGKFAINLPANYKKISLPFFKEWVTALESGKYRQGRRLLCQINNKKATYCCLGVLSKIQGRLIKTDFGFEDTISSYVGTLKINNPTYFVLNKNGLFPEGVTVTVDDSIMSCTTLATCNDNAKLSLKDIAKIIKTLYKE
jgi:hypothetical protein